MLDEADPALLQPCFDRLAGLPGKPGMRKAFQRPGERTPVAWDVTEYFNSYKLGCRQCLTRRRSNGKTENDHTMLSATVVAPGRGKVVPLMPEFIAKQNGREKQDCERAAVKRRFEKRGNRVKSLRPVYLGNDLFACHPVARMAVENGDDFVFTAKETSHKAPFDFIDGATCEAREDKVRKRNVTEIFRYKWMEDIPFLAARYRTALLERMRDGKDAIEVDWIGFQILDAKGAVEYTMS